MIWRRISLIIAKYVAISLCLITILVTTPWGTYLTLALLDTLDDISIDYHSGSLIREIELNKFQLQLDNIDLTVNGFYAEIDFSCVWKKALCIKSAKADEFYFHYANNNENISHAVTKEVARKQLFEMPFSILANTVTLKKSQLVINNTEISIEQFITQLEIKKSSFNILQPSAKQLTVILPEDEETTRESSASAMNSKFSQLPEVDLPIALVIEQLHVDNIVAKENNSQQWLSSNNQLSGAWTNTDVNISHFQTFTKQFSITELVAKAKLLPPYQLSTQFVSSLKETPWWPEVTDSTQQVSIHGSLKDLAVSINSKGSLAMASQGNVDLIHVDMPFNLTVEASKIPMPLSLSSYADPSSLFFALSGNLQEQTIDLTSQLNSYGYNNAQVSIKANHQQGQFSISEASFKDQTSLSELSINGEITLQPTDIAWQLSALSTGFSLPQMNLKELISLTQLDIQSSHLPESIFGRLQGNINSTGMWSENEWAISITDTVISGEINDAALNIKGDIGLNQTGQLQQGELFAAFNGSELTLTTYDGAFWDVKAQWSIANLNHWHQDAHGTFTSNFSVQGEQSNPVITFNSQSTQLNWQQWYSSSLDVSANYQPMNGHQLQLTVNNDSLKWVEDKQTITIDDFVVDLVGNANQHQINANWLGDIAGQLALKGQWNDLFTHWKASVEQSQITYKNIALRNNKAFPLAVDLDKQQVVIDSHCWQNTGISACLPNQAIFGKYGDVIIELAVDLSVIDELVLPEEIELISKINGDINAKWSAQQALSATAQFALSAGHIKVSDDFSEHQLSQWRQGSFIFTIDEQHFSNTLTLTDTQGQTIVDINAAIGLINNSPIEAKVSLNQFSLQPFQAVLASVVNLQGNLNADININGTLAAPVVNGGITLDSGKLRLRQDANIFDQVSSSLVIKNNQATLQGEFFVDNKAANLTGNASWQDGLSLNVDLTADSLPLVFPPQIIMDIAPRLNFSLLRNALTVSGNIDVLDGSYNIEKLAEDSVTLSDDVIIVDQHGQAVVKKSTGFDIKTDIRVNINKAFKISGQGLDSHLFGQLQVSQKEKQPFQLFGQIQSDNGTFQAYGQRLQIEKGELTFNGPLNNPYFNLRASRHIKAEDIDVGIQIIGLADALDMQLFSSPTMEVPEILSYLVRGRSLDAGAENSAAAASLLVGFGVTNSVGLFDQLEKIPLVNNIAIDTEGEGDQIQATVSGYLGDRVYLKYGIGVYEPINELTVRMYLFNRFWLEIISGIEQSTDLYYSFDID